MNRLLPVVRLPTGEVISAEQAIALTDVDELRNTLVPSLTLLGVLVEADNQHVIKELEGRPELKGLFVRTNTESTCKELRIQPHDALVTIRAECIIDLTINYTEKEQIKKHLRTLLDKVAEATLVEVEGQGILLGFGSQLNLSGQTREGVVNVKLVVPPLVNPCYLIHKQTVKFYGKIPMVFVVGEPSVTPTTILEAVAKELPTVLLTMIQNNLPYREVRDGKGKLPQDNYTEREPVLRSYTNSKQKVAKPQGSQNDKLKYPLAALLVCVILYIVMKVL